MAKYCIDCLTKNKYIEDKLAEIDFLLKTNQVLQSHIDSLYFIIKSLINSYSVKVVIKK